MKKILEACIEQILQFDNEMEWIAFHHNLKTGRIEVGRFHSRLWFFQES